MLSCEPAKDFSEAIRQPVLLNRKVDLKNWHLMVYNWNKFSEIGPRRESSFSVCVCSMPVSPRPCEGPLLTSITARDFSLLIRECEEFRSASIHFSVLTKLFDGRGLLGGDSPPGWSLFLPSPPLFLLKLLSNAGPTSTSHKATQLG